MKFKAANKSKYFNTFTHNFYATTKNKNSIKHGSENSVMHAGYHKEKSFTTDIIIRYYFQSRIIQYYVHFYSAISGMNAAYVMFKYHYPKNCDLIISLYKLFLVMDYPSV
jgi:ABC-type glycerol-3-phosphate transport system permease component